MDVSGTVNWESLRNEKFDTHEIRDETMLNSYFSSSLFSVLFLNKLGGGRVGGKETFSWDYVLKICNFPRPQALKILNFNGFLISV